jgi:glutathione S-transferase
MRILYHWPLDPFSRIARLALAEKRLTFRLSRVEFTDDPAALRAMNPAGTTPVLRDETGASPVIVAEVRPILEYLDEAREAAPLLPDDLAGRAEVRRLVEWFCVKFHAEVNAYILHERLEKPLTGGGAPDSALMREGRAHLRWHLAYLNHLVETRDWLAGTALTQADIAAAAQLSCLDYFGEVPWDAFALAKSWYVRIKSRPAFRALLDDTLPGMPPAPHYADLDF